jgi:EAL domain-containing protein (putative c-di-GMP-specific phosphodiesterase class I)
MELTESATLREPERIGPILRELSEAGLRLAIDDFGAGWSSLSRLRLLPVQILKIDRSFSAGIDGDERSCGLLRSIMVMGEALGLDVVVEGLERASQVEHVREHVGANLAQGFLLYEPLPVGDLLEVLRQNRGELAGGLGLPPRAVVETSSTDVQ